MNVSYIKQSVVLFELRILSKSFFSNFFKYFSKPKYNSPKQSLFNTKNIVNSKNDLEQIVFKIYPKLKKLKLFLIKLPNIIFARMSGSGSSIVAYFHSKKATDIAAKKFKRKFNNKQSCS